MPVNGASPSSEPAAEPDFIGKPVKVRKETLQPSVFWILATIVLPAVNLAVRYRVTDARKFPQTGAFVLSPNHFSEIDPIVIGALAWKLGRAPRFMAKASVFTIPVLGWLLGKSGQIPVERGGVARGNEPVKAARRLVERGQMVIVYPEGSLTRDPELWPMRGKTGAVRIALEQGIPIVPIAHWGTQDLMPRYSKRISPFPRKTVHVKIGDPLTFEEFRGRSLDTATLNEATAILMDAITGLLEDLRGETAPAKRWNPSDHDQKETGRFEG